ncbi:hypothetical protein FXO37_06624 [Capsicum annuum]|nr:hypothetical protein FXO37_06624 [Capsicum annuum]
MSIDEENEDLFDRLPDSIILTIFDKLQDAKSLCISSSLSKRFHFLTTQTHHISLTIPPPKKSHNNTNPNKNQLTHFLNKLLFKPFLFVLKQINKWNPICMPVTYNTRKEDRCNNCFTCTCTCACTCSSPAEILRNFREIKEFEIRLTSPPCDPLLKWKAEFGSQLKSCLIVGGTSFSPVRDNNNNDHDEDALENFPISQQRGDLMEFQRMTNEDLKLRIVWIISSLLAASARYSLLEEIIKEKRTIKEVVITDDIGQGKCCMNEEQVEEMRRNMGVISSKIPALKVLGPRQTCHHCNTSGEDCLYRVDFSVKDFFKYVAHKIGLGRVRVSCPSLEWQRLENAESITVEMRTSVHFKINQCPEMRTSV